jgi:hypothetical protein
MKDQVSVTFVDLNPSAWYLENLHQLQSMNFSLFYPLLDAIALTEMPHTLDKKFDQVYNSRG